VKWLLVILSRHGSAAWSSSRAPTTSAPRSHRPRGSGRRSGSSRTLRNSSASTRRARPGAAVLGMQVGVRHARRQVQQAAGPDRLTKDNGKVTADLLRHAGEHAAWTTDVTPASCSACLRASTERDNVDPVEQRGEGADLVGLSVHHSLPEDLTGPAVVRGQQVHRPSAGRSGRRVRSCRRARSPDTADGAGRPAGWATNVPLARSRSPGQALRHRPLAGTGGSWTHTAACVPIRAWLGPSASGHGPTRRSRCRIERQPGPRTPRPRAPPRRHGVGRGGPAGRAPPATPAEDRPESARDHRSVSGAGQQHHRSGRIRTRTRHPLWSITKA